MVEKLYKAFFVMDLYLGINNSTHWNATDKLSRYRYVMSFFYYNIAKVFYSIIFFIIILELIFTQGSLYYSYYILVIAPIIKLFFSLGNELRFSYFSKDVSLADYLYTDWKNFKFPGTFVACVGNSDIIYPFKLYPTEKQKVILEEIDQKYSPTYLPYRPKTEMLVHQRQLIERVKGRSWGIRFAAHYWEHEGKRFLHSSSYLKTYQGKRFFHSSSLLKMPGGVKLEYL